MFAFSDSRDPSRGYSQLTGNNLWKDHGFGSQLLRSSGDLKLKDYLGQGCTDPGSQVAAVQRVINGPSL